MTLHAGFAEADITPPIGAHKIGWLRDIVVDTVHDPLSVRVCVIASDPADCDAHPVAFVQLDTLSVRWTTAERIRRGAWQEFGVPAERIMVSATHNHAGPAIANCGDVPRDDDYVTWMVARAVAAVGEAVGGLEECEIGFGSTAEFGVSHNRRVVMRDGTVRTHGDTGALDVLCLEGPIDPEVAVLCARTPDGDVLGAIVNFTCHPTHHGGEPAFSAGYPGVLAAEMRTRGCPVTLFLNGACGDIAHNVDKETIGAALAEDAWRVIAEMDFRRTLHVAARSRTLDLPYRQASNDEIAGTIPGAQRFIDPAIYDRHIPAVLDRIRERGTQPAEVQAIDLDEYSLVSIPAEYFVGLGLRIKEEGYPRHALVVSCANGMVGYVPTREAFARGGYETTFAPSSRLAPEAGDLLADCAIELVKEGIIE